MRDNPIITVIGLVIIGIAFVTVGKQSDVLIAPALFWAGVVCFIMVVVIIIKMMLRR